MKKISLLFLLTGISLNAFSQDVEKNRYSGGMLILQPGYTITENNFQPINHYSSGLGGIFRLYLGDYFTTGIYGGSRKTKYNSEGSKNSYVNLNYGGPFVGLSYKVGKLRYTTSAFVGMGTITNLHIENQQDNKLTDAYHYKSSGLVFSPIISIDYPLTKRLSLTAQGVYLMSKTADNRPFKNPIFQLGILFSR